MVWKWSMCVPLLLSWGSWLFFLLQNPHFGLSVLCFLCVAGVRCSTSTVPFSSCQPPPQAWKLILLLHKYFPFLGFWCFCWRFPLVLNTSWEDLVPSSHQLSRCLYWLGALRDTSLRCTTIFLLVESVWRCEWELKLQKCLHTCINESIFPAQGPAVTL